MWLEALCERHHDEVSRLTSLSRCEEDHLQAALQQVCVQLTGRNATSQEWAYLRHEGLVAFEVLLHGYLIERREQLRQDGHVALLPPSGVVRVSPDGQFRPVHAVPEEEVRSSSSRPLPG